MESIGLKISKKINYILESNNFPSYEVKILEPILTKFILRYDKMIHNNALRFIVDRLINLKKIEIYTSCDQNEKTNLPILLIQTKNINIYIFTSEEDFYQYFSPLKKLNEIEKKSENYKTNLIVNNLLDYDTDSKIVVEDRLDSLNSVILKRIKEINSKNEYIHKVNDRRSDLILDFVSGILKSFFRLVFFLFIKNDQIDVTITLKNFGYKNNRLLFQNFINSKPLKLGSDISKLDNFFAKKCIFESFRVFRTSILLFLGSTEIKQITKSLQNQNQIINLLKKYFDKIDDILTDTFETDKLIDGKIQYVKYKVFKFLKFDDIIELLGKKLI